MRLLVDLQIHALGQQQFDGVRVAQSEGSDLALYVGAIAGAGDVELAREAGGHALYSGGGQGAGESMQSGALIGIARKLERPIRLVRFNALRHRHAELAFGTFHQHLLANRDLHALGQRNDFFAYSRHSYSPTLTKAGTEPRRPRVPCGPCCRSSRRAPWSKYLCRVRPAPWGLPGCRHTR